MEMMIPVTSTEYYGRGFITNQNSLKVGQPEGDYVIMRGVDFGKGKKGFRAVHHGTEYGTALVEIRLDSLDGKSIGVCACSSMKDWRWHRTLLGIRQGDPCSMDGVYDVWCEIEKTTGIHDVYLVFHRKCEYIRFGFTNDSPYKEKAYNPVPKKYERYEMADTWEATDMLGRKIPSPEECPEKRDKKVGMFYWANLDGIDYEPDNLTDIMKNWPQSEYDIDHHAWHYGPYHWGKPLYGYYRNADPYVLRKHVMMLAAAGVDFIAFDCSNCSWHAKRGHFALFEAFRQAKLDGINVPKVTFIMNWNANPNTEYMLRAMYQDIFKPGLYSDLWFMYEGKPVMMAFGDSIPEKGFNDLDTEFLNEMREFFTFRPCHAGYFSGPYEGTNFTEWAWCQAVPLNKFGEREDGTFEQTAVSVALNANTKPGKPTTYTFFNDTDTFGRSYTTKDGNSRLTEDSYKYGYNFQEQWDNALELDPDIVFVTGWNEWCVSPGSTRGSGNQSADDPNQLSFCDLFDTERSRDIEPDADGYLDTYFLQLVSNVRKYKGTNKLPKASGEIKDIKTVEWNKVKPAYLNFKGSTPRRDFPGWGQTLRYKTEAGRNDILECRVARDSENVYFYAKCADAIKEAEAENAMVLYLDLDRSKKTGWEGYELRVSGKELQKSKGTYYEWEKVGTVKKQVKGDTVVITIPKKKLNLGKYFDIEFKWSDNAFTGEREAGDIMDFYIGGVVAPLGRFNYRYKTK